MSVFKSLKRKIFRNKKDIDELILFSETLVDMIESDQKSFKWFNSSGVRLIDSNGWVIFKDCVKKLSPLLLAFLLGCSVTPVTKSGPPVPRSITKSLTNAPTDRLVTFLWNHPDPTNIDFYALYYGPKSRSYTNKWIALSTNYSTRVTLKNAMYYTVTAGKTNGLESDFSNELIYPRHLEPRTNVTIITMWSTNGVDWIDLNRKTNAVPGFMGLWKLRIE